jgi:hypothetical protein
MVSVFNLFSLFSVHLSPSLFPYRTLLYPSPSKYLRFHPFSLSLSLSLSFSPSLSAKSVLAGSRTKLNYCKEKRVPWRR